MAQIESVEMPDGTVIFARVEADDSSDAGADVGLRDRLKLENLGETVRSVATSVHHSVSGMKADKVAVEFGLELALEPGGVVAVLASGGVKAALKVTLEWGTAADDSA